MVVRMPLQILSEVYSVVLRRARLDEHPSLSPEGYPNILGNLCWKKPKFVQPSLISDFNTNFDFAQE